MHKSRSLAVAPTTRSSSRWERLQRLVRQTLSFALRTFFGTWFALIAMIAAHIAILQALPTRHWLNFHSVELYLDGAQPKIRIYRSVTHDINARVFGELRLVNDSGAQGCAHEQPVIVEQEPHDMVTLSLADALPNCDLARFAGHAVHLQLGYDLSLDYGIHKRTIRLSNDLALPTHLEP